MKSDLDEKLAHAAYMGSPAEMERLIAEGADPKADDSEALRLAARNGHLECVKLLIPHSDPATNDSAALRWAANYGHLECVKLLIPYSDPKADGSAALRRAAEEGHLECVRELIPYSDPEAAIRHCFESGDTDAANVIREQLAMLLAEQQREQIRRELDDVLGHAPDAPRKARRM